MNAANIISLIRIALVVVFVALYRIHTPGCVLAALIVFLAAAVSDGIDGAVARRYNMVTSTGKFLDPLADKILVVSALIMLAASGAVSAVAVAVIAARELVVTSFRLVAVEQGVVIAADRLGKLKTVTQIIAVVSALLSELVFAGFFSALTPWLVLTAVICTLISGINYILKNRAVLNRM